MNAETVSSCDCGSLIPYAQCCEPFIRGARRAPTAEALMRSRYTAHVRVDIPYLRATLAPSARHDFNEKEVRKWARDSQWLGLKIVKAEGSTVEFLATYRADGKVLEHHEVATFIQEQDHWYFVDGDVHVHEEGQGHHDHAPLTPIVRENPKVGRNDPCACGSGKKFKKCCG